MYKRQVHDRVVGIAALRQNDQTDSTEIDLFEVADHPLYTCLLYTSDAADERSSVDLGGRRIIKKKKRIELRAS